MTTVSKPKRRPPKAATTVLLRRYRFMGWRTGGPHGMVSRATRGSQTRVFSNDIMVGSERWQSGRSHPPRKRAYLDGYREFESPPLRQPSHGRIRPEGPPLHVPARTITQRNSRFAWQNSDGRQPQPMNTGQRQVLLRSA